MKLNKPTVKKTSKIELWKVKSSKYPLKDKWIKVRADECFTKAGVRIAPYYVLEYSDWVHMVVVDVKQRILITRQYRHGAGRVITELPCGTVESRDKSHLAAAKRELMEETGYSGTFTLVATTSPNPANHANKIYTYLVTDPTRRKNPESNPFEILDYRFADIKTILKLIDNREFAQAIHISSLFLALRKAKNIDWL